MSFFYVCNPKYANQTKGIPLKVVRNNGVQVNPNININVNDLISNKKDEVFKNFYNRGNSGITFNIQVIIRKNETKGSISASKGYYPQTSKVLNWLDYFIKNMMPVYVVTDAIDIKNGTYIITDNSKRVQTFKDYTIWDLEFTTFTGLNSVHFTNTNKAIKKVVKKSKKSKNTKKTSAKSKSTIKSKLKKCKLTQLKYTGKKVTNITCVKYLQQILYKNYGLLTKRQVDGWYGPKTLNAVKKYQKKKKLKQTGKVNKATFKSLCK